MSTGILAALVVVAAVITAFRPNAHTQSVEAQILGFWEELSSRRGQSTTIEFTPDHLIRLWEGIPRTSIPTRTDQFSIKADSLIIAGEEAWATRIRIEDGLLALETNSVTWFKRVR